MTSVITGDIINSRNADPKDWLTALKRTFAEYGKSPKVWEIYGGDSFTIEIKEAYTSFLAAIKIKASIKVFKDIDVRMAIGIGEKTFDAPRITESNGPAFINSGDVFEIIKRSKQTFILKSPWSEVDKELNLIMNLSAIAMDKWTPSSAELVKLFLQFNTLSQKELGRKLKITQSSISERQTRAHYNEIMEAESFFNLKIKQQIN